MISKKNTFEEVVQKLHIFRKERGWLGIASVDLAKSIVLEAAELLEHYQWDTTDTNNNRIIKKDKHKISSEVADIFTYILQFCQVNNIDLLQETFSKIERNSKKYPAKSMKDGGQEAYDKAKKNYRKNN